MIRPAPGDMILYTSGGVTDEVAMSLHMRKPNDQAVSILFGNERITLDFYDVQSLERLRDLADEGARRLHAAIEMNEEPIDSDPVP
ncbi:hypothetical protein JOF56_000746 [Kibdelosporangium banguiense]|uniref:Uncharacterized protein n=1 Tax=Kibdelosporangium banguiense TaxID=1365924 RepID=A0ABS4T7S3_9PSEU|nr:hypothetical protein [Kibdelosporangium banguiense]MBP2320361.1 hypothetical protein [Kibdelosporangium banguiense]